MSLPTLAPADDFSDFEFAALVADLGTQPLGEPEPQPRPSFQRSRAAERRADRELIDRELGIRRYRRGERQS